MKKQSFNNMEKFNIEDVISNKSILELNILNIALGMKEAYLKGELSLEEDIQGHKKIREIYTKLGNTKNFLKLLTIEYFPFIPFHVGTIVEVKLEDGRKMTAVVCFYELTPSLSRKMEVEVHYRLIFINDDGLPFLKDNKVYSHRQLSPLSQDTEYGSKLIAYYEYCHM